MDTLLAWLWLPLVITAACIGLGRLLEAIARYRVAPAVRPVVGLALAVAVVELGYRAGLTVAAVLPVLAVAGLAGLVMGRRERAQLRPGPAIVAAVGTYLLYLAPVLLSGSVTWAGYNFTNDPALLFTGADWILHHGYGAPSALDSTSLIAASGVVSQGYPLGSHLVLGTFAPLAGASFADAIQPFMALVGALGSASATCLLRRAGMPGWAAAGAAVVASGAGLLYVYAELGGLKEVTTVTVILAAAAIGRDVVRDRLPLGAVVVLGVVLSSLGGILSLGGYAYAGVLAVALGVFALAAHIPLPRLAAAALVGGVTMLVASGVVLADSISFGSEAASQLGGEVSTGVFGQLLRPLPLTQIGGVWLGADWRAPVAEALQADVTTVLNAIAIALACLGAAWALLQRQVGVVAALASVTVVAAVIAPRTAPYGDSKLLIVMTPLVLLSAACGAWALAGIRSRAGAVVAGALSAALLGGVFLTDAITYRQARLAPVDRMEAIEDVAAAARGRGMVLFNEWEEYAKYFARDAQVNVPGEVVGPKPFVLREPQPTFARHFDLDELDLAYVLSFPAAIIRRGPATSRPPASFSLVYRNRYYELWAQDPSVEVRAHLPLQASSTASAPVRCAELEAFARKAQPGESLVAHRLPEQPSMSPATARDRSFGWGVIDATTVLPNTPGHASGAVQVSRRGRYTVWVRGTSGRAVDAVIDGRVVGKLQHVNSPAQWVDVATVSLDAGRHVLGLRRPGGSLGPGNAYKGELGPVTLTPVDDAGELVRVAPSEAATLCGQRLDWVERVDG